MHAFNVLSPDNIAFCFVVSGPKEVENMCNHIFIKNYTIVNIIPLNHITSDSSRYFHIFYYNAGEPFIDRVYFYDINKYIFNKAYTIVRILPELL